MAETYGEAIRRVIATTVPGMPLDPVTARELSRAAAQAKTWTEKRDQLIREALAAGGGVREVARAAGIDHSTLIARLKREAKP